MDGLAKNEGSSAKSKKKHSKNAPMENDKGTSVADSQLGAMDAEVKAAKEAADIDKMLIANDVSNIIKEIVSADAKDHSGWKQMLRDVCDLIKWDRHGFAATKVSHVRFPEEYVLKVNNQEYLHNAISFKYFRQKFSNMPHIEYECVQNHMVIANNLQRGTFDLVALEVTYTKDGQRSGLLPRFLASDQPRGQSSLDAIKLEVRYSPVL